MSLHQSPHPMQQVGISTEDRQRPGFDSSSHIILAVESPLFVTQCRFLETVYSSNITSSVLSSPDEVSFTQIKKKDFTYFLIEHIQTSSFTSGLQPFLCIGGLKCGIILKKRVSLHGISCSLALLKLLHPLTTSVQ